MEGQDHRHLEPWLAAPGLRRTGGSQRLRYFYLRDAADCLSRGLKARAALSCSCAASCLERTGNSNAARTPLLRGGQDVRGAGRRGLRDVDKGGAVVAAGGPRLFHHRRATARRQRRSMTSARPSRGSRTPSSPSDTLDQVLRIRRRRPAEAGRLSLSGCAADLRHKRRDRGVHASQGADRSPKRRAARQDASR